MPCSRAIFLNITGWMIVGLLVAWAICARKTACKKTDESGLDVKKTDDAGMQEKDSSWCEVLEALMSCAAIRFDSQLKVVSAGASAARLFAALNPQGKASGHLMDIVPPLATPAFIDGVAAALRGEKKSWEAVLGGKKMSIRAVPGGSEAILVIGEVS